MAWRMDSTAGAHIWDTEPMSAPDLACRDEELRWLMRQEGRRWSLINGRIAGSGDPTMMARGNYGAPAAYALDQANTGIAVGTSNVALWTPASYSPIPANSVQAPMSFRLRANGLVTTSAASLTTTITGAVGTAVTGTSMGASTAMSLPGATAITNAYWDLQYTMTIRTGGESGTAVGFGNIVWTTAAGPSASTSQELFGGGNTVASSINWVTTAQGLLIYAVASATTVTIQPTQIHFANWD